MVQPRIKVFWDLESCPPPTSYTGSPWDLLKSIRLFTSQFGIVTSIKAYWDRNKARDAGPNAISLRAAMPSLGISLTDCSLAQEYSRDALARMLTVDFLISAIDDPVNADVSGGDIIMILSGDKTLLHPISLLMFRGYTVFLVAPDRNEKIHSSHATRVFGWHAEVLKVNSSSLPGPQSTPAGGYPRTQESSPSGARAALDLDGTTSSAPQTMSSSQSLSSIVSSRPISPPRPLSSASVFTSSITSPRRNMSPLHLVAPSTNPVPPYPMSPRTFVASTNPPSTPKSKPRSIPASEPPRSRAPSVLSFNSEAPGSSFSVAHKPSTNIRPANPPDIRAQMLDQTSPAPAQGDAKDTDNDWGMGSGWSQSGNWEMESSNWLPEPKTNPGKPKTETPKVIPTNVEPPPPTTKPQVEPRQKDLQFGQFDAQPQPEPPKPDNSPFEPLLQFLRKSQAEGRPTVLRSVIGVELAKNKDVYQAVGTTNFSSYVTLAAQRGLVNLGGVGGRAWIGLRS